MSANYYAPPKIAENIVELGVKKASMSALNMLMLGIIAGLYLSFAGHGTEVLVQNVTDIGTARLLSAIVFPVGLILILLAGGELFTGNCLIMMACLDKKAKWIHFAKSLGLVYLGNLIGSLIVVTGIFWLNTVNHTDAQFGGYAVKVAAYKSNMTFGTALVSGIFANFLVCLGVWLCYAAKDIGSKIIGIFLPIYLFIITGCEHVIANMYYIPMGLFAKTNPDNVTRAMSFFHVSPEKIEGLTLSNAIVNNFIPATIGNFIGGAILLGAFYWFVYLKESGKVTGIVTDKSKVEATQQSNN